MSDLLSTPMRVLRTLDDEALIQLARGVPTWTDALAERLDAALAERVVDALLSGDHETLDACDRLLGRAALPSVRPVLDALERRWASRWRGWAQLLAVREGQLANHDLEAVKRRAHVEEILTLVRAQPGLTQTELAARAGLAKAHLSRLLTVLEDHGLMERRARGRERTLHLRETDVDREARRGSGVVHVPSGDTVGAGRAAERFRRWPKAPAPEPALGSRAVRGLGDRCGAPPRPPVPASVEALSGVTGLVR